MSCVINFEREFFRIAKRLETKEEVKSEFMQTMLKMSEERIDDKLNRDIKGLRDKEQEPAQPL